MARYNREFLVPYLQNICALHLAEEKLIRRYNQLKNTASRIRCGKDNPKPEEPDEETWGCGTALSIGLGIFSIYVCITVTGTSAAWVCLFFIPLIIVAGFGIYNIFECKRINERNERWYNDALAKYERIEAINRSERNKATPFEQEMERCAQEIDRVIAVRDRMYGANIIPNKYRGIYPAVYLYDWFSSSQADDLDHALAMYVLEEIKSRLDTIIDNQSDMILNQRIMMANQQKSFQQQRSYENMMRAKLNQMHMTQEEQLNHTRMIESNTAATAYFAAANYIRNI